MSTFRSNDPWLTIYESTETGRLIHLDGLPIEIQGDADEPGWLLVRFPTVGIEDYPVRTSEVEV